MVGIEPTTRFSTSSAKPRDKKEDHIPYRYYHIYTCKQKRKESVIHSRVSNRIRKYVMCCVTQMLLKMMGPYKDIKIKIINEANPQIMGLSTLS